MAKSTRGSENAAQRIHIGDTVGIGENMAIEAQSLSIHVLKTRNWGGVLTWICTRTLVSATGRFVTGGFVLPRADSTANVD